MKVLSKDNDVYNLYLPDVIPKNANICFFIFIFSDSSHMTSCIVFFCLLVRCPFSQVKEVPKRLMMVKR